MFGLTIIKKKKLEEYLDTLNKNESKIYILSLTNLDLSKACELYKKQLTETVEILDNLKLEIAKFKNLKAEIEITDESIKELEISEDSIKEDLAIKLVSELKLRKDKHLNKNTYRLEVFINDDEKE